MKKNVLLLGVSPLLRIHGNNYTYEWKKGKYIKLTGILTNEAPAKAVISKLSKKGERLDRIVMLCTQKVKEPITAEWPEKSAGLPEASEDTKPEKPTDLIAMDLIKKLSKDVHSMSTAEYYKEIISEFARETDHAYEQKGIEFEEIPVEDYTDKNEISRAVIQAAQSVEDTDGEIDLYIDYNGGFRSMAFMLVSISNLMDLKNITVKEILSMNFEDKVNGVTLVKNQIGIFESQRLVTGIDAYIKYGRVKGLKEYFAASEDSEIHKILESMEQLSENLQLCRVGYIMRERGNLAEVLDRYTDVTESKDLSGPQEMLVQLFAYVVQDIRQGYDALLRGELPDILDWCINKGYMQQALTFCTEELPGYLWNHKIYFPGETEESEFCAFIGKVKEDDNINNRPRGFESIPEEKSSDYAYAWMINYLPYSATDKEIRRYCSGMKNYAKGQKKIRSLRIANSPRK